MTKNFNPAEQNLDIAWLLKNGWTVNGNLACRHILHEYVNTKTMPCAERIEQILLQYDAINQKDKICEALVELIELKETLFNSREF